MIGPAKASAKPKEFRHTHSRLQAVQPHFRAYIAEQEFCIFVSFGFRVSSLSAWYLFFRRHSIEINRGDFAIGGGSLVSVICRPDIN